MSDEFSFLDTAVDLFNRGQTLQAQAAAQLVIATELTAVRRELTKTRNELALLLDHLVLLSRKVGAS
jgi:hypothetical protein